jgi:hypothetical protein
MTGTMNRVLTFVLVMTLVLCSASSVYGITDELLASRITWKVMALDKTYNRLIVQTATLPFNNEFVLDTSDAAIAGSEDILQALDGVRFTMERTSLTGSLTVCLILNLNGNEFLPSVSTRRVNCCFNMDIELFVDGAPVNSDQFTLVMTIPAGSGLDYLLDLCDGTESTVSFANYTGGIYSTERISTSFHQGLVVNIQSPLTVVGGRYSELGIPANVGYSTWYKVKKLFE